MALNQTYSLNMIPGTSAPVRITATQYDNGNRTITFNLYAGSEVYKIPSDCSVVIEGEKPDKKGFTTTADSASGSTVKITLTKQMTAVGGNVDCQLSVISGETVLGSAGFVLAVKPAALSEDSDLSESDYSAIQEAVESCLSSRSAAATSAANAAASEKAAGTSATSASTYATQASNSATAAKGSASTAASKASAAETSATNAATSESNAKSSAEAAASEASAAEGAATAAAASERHSKTYAANASTSEENAAASESNAKTSASTAASEASAAETSATNAATSESNAKSSAEAAASEASAAEGAATAAAASERHSKTYAANASTSEENAAASESNAKTSASTAASEASAAATSATNAATSEANAKSSADAAASSASAAATSATNAATSESNAKSSAEAAASEASAAEGAATAAAASERHSKTYAANASTSEENAAASESNAKTSETNAAASATAAAASAKEAKESADEAATLLYSGAGPHNAVYRGKYLGATVTSTQWATIKDGSFTDLYIGDYWTIGGINYRIAAFDYYYNAGDTACTTHHVVIVPDKNMYTYCMNDTNVTTGAYVGSKMYKEGLTQAKTTVNNAFGSAHILSHRQYLQNAITNGYASGGNWYDSTVELMTEQNVYGCKVLGNCISGTASPNNYTIDKSQYPLFAYRFDMISNRQWFWLRDVSSNSTFCDVTSGNYADNSYASNVAGVRPAFSIC